jgi:NAD kinase
VNRLTETKIILVVRATRLADLKARFATKMQAKFYVSRLGGDFSDYESEDAEHQAAMAKARQILAGLGRVQVVQRALLPNFVFGPEDIVVALGQDGLVANTLKYLAGQPLLGVNPDPKRWDGLLLPFTVRDLDKVTREVLRKRRPTKAVTMAQVTLNTGPTLFAVNDFFIGARSHVSARYRIQHGQQAETHSSSGVIVSTGLGSSGWLKSLLTGAAAITQSAGTVLARQPTGELLPTKPESSRTRTRLNVKTEFPWDADHLFFTVR